MTTVEDLKNKLEEFKRTVPEARAMQLRLSLAELVIQGMKRKGWTPEDLAKKVGISQAVVGCIIYADGNYTLNTIGKIFFALDIWAEIVEVEG